MLIFLKVSHKCDVTWFLHHFRITSCATALQTHLSPSHPAFSLSDPIPLHRMHQEWTDNTCRTCRRTAVMQRQAADWPAPSKITGSWPDSAVVKRAINAWDGLIANQRRQIFHSHQSGGACLVNYVVGLMFGDLCGESCDLSPQTDHSSSCATELTDALRLLMLYWIFAILHPYFRFIFCVLWFVFPDSRRTSRKCDEMSLNGRPVCQPLATTMFILLQCPSTGIFFYQGQKWPIFIGAEIRKLWEIAQGFIWTEVGDDILHNRRRSYMHPFREHFPPRYLEIMSPTSSAHKHPVLYTQNQTERQ